jgi:hypothetical protein
MRVSNVGIVLFISFAVTSACVGPMSQTVVTTGSRESSLDQAVTASSTRTEATDEKSNEFRGETQGMRIYLDPGTGEVTTQPQGSAAAQSQKEALQAIKPAVTELYETVSPVPGGGLMIDLKDQFRSPLAATVDSNGKVAVKHQSEVSE